MRYSIDQDNSAWRVVDGEAVLINAETTFYYGLNSTATQIWKLLLDEDLTANEIADRLAPVYARSPADITEGVNTFVEELTDEKLLTVADSTVSSPSREPHAGLADGDEPGAWESPELTRYDTLEELIVCGE